MTVVHRPFRFLPHPTKASQWDDKSFVFISDVMRGNNILTRVLANEAFEVTGQHKVPKLDEFDTLLNALPSTEHYLPLPARSAATDELQSRYMVQIPHAYIDLAFNLTSQNASPRTWWKEMGGAVRADKKEKELELFFDFLRLSCVRQSNDVTADRDPGTLIGTKEAIFPPLDIDEELNDRIHDVLTQDFPNTQPGDTTGAAASTGLVTVMREEGALHRAQREQERRDQEAKEAARKKPSYVFPNTHTKWMRNCNVTSESNLQPLYSRWAEIKQGERRPELQNTVDLRSLEDTAAGKRAPIVTKELFDMTMKGNLGSRDINILTQGVSPFTADPLHHADVFVDDGIVAAQGTPATLNRYRRQLLHINDNVFRPSDGDDPAERKEPVSIKKLLQGDACWTTRKLLLGWIVDTLEQTLSLPPHRIERLREIVATARERKQWSPKFTHKLLGELRSMTLAIPGGSGLFSHLQHTLTEAMRGRTTRFRPSPEALRELNDWYLLAKDISSRPTRLAELFPTTPGHYYGATDAAKPGFGGIILPQPTQTFPPLVWRAPLPRDLQSEIVSTNNLHGTITNSDLELAATIIHEAAMATAFDITERTIYTGCDNTPAVAWRGRGSVTTTGPAAAMLRYASLQQRALCHVPRLNYIPGEANVLADAASRQQALADAPTASRDSFLDDLRSAKKKAKTSVNPDRANAVDSLFNTQWIPFLLELNIIDPFLTDLHDKIPVLRCSGQPVRGSHVRDEISHIAKTYSELGYPDPRLTVHGNLDPRLTTLYSAFRNEDPAPKRIKPMPIQVLFRAQAFILPTSDAIDHATMDMAWIGLFYLLRPGEHCKSHENTPIKLRDVTLLNETRRLNPFTASAAEIAGATHSSITFDTQKNRERGETIGHSTSGHPIACPTKAIGRRILYLRSHHATPDTYLCAVRRTTSWTHVTSALITASLRIATASLPHLNFAITDVSARSLRAGGAMALLCGKVDRDIIRLVGRWKSDAMFRYLHAQALPIVRNLASTILQHGAFTLLPGIDIPAEAATVIA